MKRLVLIFSVVSTLSLILGACGGSGPGAAGLDATEAPATGAPAAPTDAATPQVVPVDLAGPAMEVGSKYIYVDGEVIVAVPGSPFKAGYSFADNPERTLTLGDFWIYNSEVTNQQYSLCVAAGKCMPPDPKDNPGFSNYRFINFPVVGVNWQQSADYCSFVHARLPGEWEWEKAARGPDGNIFPWGNGAPSCNLLNFNFCKGAAINIQSFPDGVSYYGLFDMAGNVNEWVADWYDPGFPLVSPELGDKRSVRSSSFDVGGDFAIAAHRSSLKPTSHLPNLGFRCVVDDPTYFAPLCSQLAFIGSGPTGSEADCVPGIKCNDVSISEGQACTTGNTPYTIITFHVSNQPPLLWTFSANGCWKPNLALPTQFQCDPPGPQTAVAHGTCMVTNSCDPSCPLHYNMVGDACVWDGSGTIGTECIAGTTYDPLNQCCAATPGSGVDFSICPDGYYPLNGICVKDPTAVEDSESVAVSFKTCTPGEQPCDPAVDPTCGNCSPSNPVTCSGLKVPSADGCSCVCPTGASGC